MIDHELWQNASDSDIIDHILPRYHDTHRRQLDELIPLAEKVAGVHAGKFPASSSRCSNKVPAALPPCPCA